MTLLRRDCLVASNAVGVAALGECLTSAASDERPEYRTEKTLHVSPDGRVTQPFEVPEDLRLQSRLDVDEGDVKAWIADDDRSGSDLSLEPVAPCEASATAGEDESADFRLAAGWYKVVVRSAGDGAGVRLVLKLY